MKKYFALITILMFIISCKPTGDFLTRKNQERALLDAVKFLEKNPDDAGAKQAIVVLYPRLQQQHLSNIDRYQMNTDLSRWDDLSNEYGSLQKMYEAIAFSPTASVLVKAENYQPALNQLRQNAAEAYYQQALRLNNTNNKIDARTAYALFKRANSWVQGYKDVANLIQIAWQNSIINVIINPIRDNNWVTNNHWNNFNNFSYDNFPQTLVRELGGSYASLYPVRFFTDWEARRNNMMPDWSVNISFQKFDQPRPQDKKRLRTVSKQIEDGRDKEGKVLYKTVTANIAIYEQTMIVRGRMDLEIVDFNTRRNICMESYTDDFISKNEYATFTGDKDALDEVDWRLINKRGNQGFISREEITNELYRKLYPNIKNRIESAVRWY